MNRQFASQAAQYFVRPHTVTPSKPLEHAAAWYGRDMVDRFDDWLVLLNSEEIDSLEEAALGCLQQGMTLDDLTTQTFVIPQLSARLKEVTREVSTGRGFCVVRGMPVQRWARSSRRLFTGVWHSIWESQVYRILRARSWGTSETMAKVQGCSGSTELRAT